MDGVLVVRGGAIGDFVLTLPVIAALEKKFSENAVEVLANRAVASLLRQQRFALDDSRLACLFARNATIPVELRQWLARFSTALIYLHDPEQIFEMNLQACGVARVLRGPWKLDSSSHAVEQLAKPLQEIGIQAAELRPRLQVGAGEKNLAQLRLGVEPQHVVVVHPGSGSAAKNWPLQNWVKLCGELKNEGVQIAVVAGEADRPQLARFRDTFGSEVVYAVEWPLREVAALVSGRIFVGHDSGISHLAAAAGARCVVLFGPTDPRVWAPRGDNVSILGAENADLTRLKVETVMQATRSHLAV